MFLLTWLPLPGLTSMVLSSWPGREGSGGGAEGLPTHLLVPSAPASAVGSQQNLVQAGASAQPKAADLLLIPSCIPVGPLVLLPSTTQ